MKVLLARISAGGCPCPYHSGVFFMSICAQMKVFIDRTYPIWKHFGQKEVYYIISAGTD